MSTSSDRPIVTVEVEENVIVVAPLPAHVEATEFTTPVSVSAPGPAGPPGPPGPAGGESFTFIQTASVNHWVVNHGLGRYPGVIITEIDGVRGRYGGDVNDVDLNTLTIDFLHPHIGEAELE